MNGQEWSRCGFSVPLARKARIAKSIPGIQQSNIECHVRLYDMLVPSIVLVDY